MAVLAFKLILFFINMYDRYFIHFTYFMLELSEETFIPYAKKHYTNNFCFSEEEFLEDLRRIRYIKILINRYADTGVLQERLLLNHFISMGNVFDIEALVRMLFFKISDEYHPILKSFLDFLHYMPKIVYNVDGINIWSSDIKEDTSIKEKLNKL